MDIVSKTTGKQHTAAEMNQVVNEMEYAIERSGQTLDPEDTTQLWRSMGIVLLSRTLAVDLDSANGTELSLYTVPTGETVIITHVIMHTLSADAANTEVTFGLTGGDCDEWRGNQTLSELNFTVNKYIIIYLDQGVNDTPEGSPMFVATDVFAMEITQKQGTAATVTIDVFGYRI